MKRATLLFIVLLAVSASAIHAQTSYLQLGPGVGVVISTIVGDDTDDVEGRTSLFGGASLVIHKSGSAIGFETGLYYVPKGASVEGFEGEGALEITYFEVPALLRLGFRMQNSEIMPVLLLGGSIGLKGSCKVSAESGSASASIDCDDSAFQGELDLKAVDFGISAGAAVDIPMGARTILAPSIRYTRGLSNIGDTSDNADAKNSAIQIGAVLRFRL
jgi:hypothetical protein